MSSDVLFRPFKLKGLNLPNRVVMAPMTRSFSPDGVPTEDVARLLPPPRRRSGRAHHLRGHGRGSSGIAERSERSPLPWREGAGRLEARDRRGARRRRPDGAAALACRRRAHARPELVAPGAYDSPSGLSRPGHKFGEPMSDEDIADAIAPSPTRRATPSVWASTPSSCTARTAI